MRTVSALLRNWYANGVGQRELRHGENALIDREHGDPRRAVRAVTDGERFARLGLFGGVDFDAQPAAFEVCGEWRDRVGQRTHEDFLGVQRAHEAHVDVGRAVEVRWDRDALHAAGARGFEPLVRVDALALDGDEAAARVGRGDGDLDVFARAILFLGELDFEFCVLFERARDLALTNDRVFEAADDEAGGIAQFDDEVAGFVVGQGVFVSWDGWGEGCAGGRRGFCLIGGRVAVRRLAAAGRKVLRRRANALAQDDRAWSRRRIQSSVILSGV